MLILLHNAITSFAETNTLKTVSWKIPNPKKYPILVVHHDSCLSGGCSKVERFSTALNIFITRPLVFVLPFDPVRIMILRLIIVPGCEIFSGLKLNSIQFNYLWLRVFHIALSKKKAGLPLQIGNPADIYVPWLSVPVSRQVWLYQVLWMTIHYHYCN